MRKKFRIFSTITAMVLVVLVMCVGIWAASQATVTGTGNLIFTTSGDVSATVILDKSYENEEFTSDSQLVINSGAVDSYNQDFEDFDMNFTSSNRVKEFAIQITNNNDAESMTISITFTEPDSDYSVTYKSLNSKLSTSGNSVTGDLGASEVDTIIVTIELADNAAPNSEEKISFNISLTGNASTIAEESVDVITAE